MWLASEMFPGWLDSTTTLRLVYMSELLEFIDSSKGLDPDYVLQAFPHFMRGGGLRFENLEMCDLC